MAQSKFNHASMIENFSKVSSLKFIRPGMIIRFRYSAPKAFDDKPLILFLWLEQNKTIHGLNLNYLNLHDFKLLFKTLNLDFTVGELHEDERHKTFYDDFTRVVIPSTDTKKTKDRTLSHVEAKDQMLRMYNTLIKPKILNKANIYRKYLRINMSTIEAINIKKIL